MKALLMKELRKSKKRFSAASCLLLICSISFSAATHADIITDWNITARNIVVDSKLVTPYANRAVAVVHTSIYVAVNSITQEFPHNQAVSVADGGESIQAAVASAS